jgi:hypothetical protein
VSPIFVRPVREQLEHDRLIRFLQAKFKRKFEVVANVGDEQAATIKVGEATFFPDLVLSDGRRIAAVIEVETGESVNNLEALAQWTNFSRTRAPFHLYVPVAAHDSARRLCESHHVKVAEIWTYRAALEGFDLVRGYHDSSAMSLTGAKPKAAAAGKTTAAGRSSRNHKKKAATPARKKASRPARPAKASRRPPAKKAKKR